MRHEDNVMFLFYEDMNKVVVLLSYFIITIPNYQKYRVFYNMRKEII